MSDPHFTPKSPTNWRLWLLIMFLMFGSFLVGVATTFGIMAYLQNVEMGGNGDLIVEGGPEAGDNLPVMGTTSASDPVDKSDLGQDKVGTLPSASTEPTTEAALPVAATPPAAAAKTPWVCELPGATVEISGSPEAGWSIICNGVLFPNCGNEARLPNGDVDLSAADCHVVD